MNHLTHPQLYEEHSGIWALSPARILALFEALERVLPIIQSLSDNSHGAFKADLDAMKRALGSQSNPGGEQK